MSIAEFIPTLIGFVTIGTMILASHRNLAQRLTRLDARVELRMDRLESRMDRLESRMGRLESRMDRVEIHNETVNARFAKIDARLDQLSQDFRDLRTEFKSDASKFDDRLYALAARLAPHLERWERDAGGFGRPGRAVQG